jgi:hypothetical protein
MNTDGISMTVKAGRKPRQAWQEDCTGWTVFFRCEGRRFQTPFFMGSGHNGRPPEVREVLDALLADAAMYESLDPAMWAKECGFEPYDAWEPVYGYVKRQSEGLKRLLGEQRYNTMLEGE